MFKGKGKVVFIFGLLFGMAVMSPFGDQIITIVSGADGDSSDDIWTRAGTTIFTNTSGDDVDVNGTVICDDLSSGNTVSTAFFNSNFVGGIDMTGDPWYLGGVDWEIAQDFILDGYVLSDLLPNPTLNRDLGSGAYRWENIFGSNGSFDDINATHSIGTLGDIWAGGYVNASYFVGDGSGLTGVAGGEWNDVGDNLYPNDDGDNVVSNNTMISKYFNSTSGKINFTDSGERITHYGLNLTGPLNGLGANEISYFGGLLGADSVWNGIGFWLDNVGTSGWINFSSEYTPVVTPFRACTAGVNIGDVAFLDDDVYYDDSVGQLQFDDNIKAVFGTGNDAEIYVDSDDDLIIGNTNNQDAIEFWVYDGNYEKAMAITTDGADGTPWLDIDNAYVIMGDYTGGAGDYYYVSTGGDLTFFNDACYLVSTGPTGQKYAFKHSTSLAGLYFNPTGYYQFLNSNGFAGFSMHYVNYATEIRSTVQNALTLGNGTANIDYDLDFNGESNDGHIRFMEDEDCFTFSDVMQLPQLTSAPASPLDGMIAYADGTSWNPGSGEGVYAYYNGGWNHLG